MGDGAKPTLRIPLLLLTIADLALLAMRLRPWPEIFSLPGNGATGIDPGVTLVAYLGLVFWLTGSEAVRERSEVTTLGLVGGLLLAFEVWLGTRVATATAPQIGYAQDALFVITASIWGIAGMRAARSAGAAGPSILAGAWSAMVSALVAVAATLGLYFITGPPPESPDSYKQFQDIGIGDPATIVLVHSLSAALGFLLLCPLAGSVLGLVFAAVSPKAGATKA